MVEHFWCEGSESAVIGIPLALLNRVILSEAKGLLDGQIDASLRSA